jgi:hypothetical protein
LTTKPHYVKQWTLKTIVQELHRQAIMDLCKTLSGAEPGDRNYIGSYQVATKKFTAEELTEEQRKEYTVMADQWNKEGIPADTRRR